MPVYLARPSDWVKVAIIAYVAVKAMNYALEKAGKPEFKI